MDGTKLALPDSSPVPHQPQDQSRVQALVQFLLRRRKGNGGETATIDPLDELDHIIPPIVDDFHPTTGERYQRYKEMDVATVRNAMSTVFGNYGEKQDDLENASRGLFSKLVIRDADDTRILARIDHFIAGYPNNIIEQLGDHASAENILAVLDAGGSLLDMIDQEEAQYHAHIGSANKASVAEILGAKLAQLVIFDEEFVTGMQIVATEEGVNDTLDFINFRYRHRHGLPSPPYSAETLTGQAAPESPFVHEDAAVAWKSDSQMSKLERSAVWGDLGEMTAIADQWDQEYGLVVRRGEDGVMSLNFMRGGSGSVKNKHESGNGGDLVFIHAHPKQSSENGLFAPLISPSDMEGTHGFDYGGAYLNIVCGSGITLQYNSQPALPEDPPRGWVVESGAFKGQIISPNGHPLTTNRKLMRNLQDLGLPFAYSIRGYGDGSNKFMFIHIPWSHLDTSGVSLEDVCFGNGLRRVVPSELQTTGEAMPNLHSAIQKAKESF